MRMRFENWHYRFMAVIIILVAASTAFAAYHHMGDTDSDLFQSVYPQHAGTKLDHCALCHTGGEYEKKPGVFVSLGSCQWCHYEYGYDGSGDIDATLNDYGRAFRDNGRNETAFTTIEMLDSDNDGFSNKDEIEALRYPGDPNDDPTKVEAPFKVYTLEELEDMPSHSQFMLMNTHKSGDFYTRYEGVTMEALLSEAGMLDSATGIIVHAPDGWSQYHPIEPDEDPLMYPVSWEYPVADYFYEPEADQDMTDYGWCDYTALACQEYTPYEPIINESGNQMILALKRDGNYLEPGQLNEENKLDGEGPFRVVPPQKVPGPPDQSSKSDVQDVIWPFDETADHNAGFATRSATIIRVDPLPEGTTDINTLEAGWDYIDAKKIVIYGAIDPMPTIAVKLDELCVLISGLDKDAFKRPAMKRIMIHLCKIMNRLVKKEKPQVVKKAMNHWMVKKSDGCSINGEPDNNDWIIDCEAQKQVYWKINELLVLLNIPS